MRGVRLHLAACALAFAAPFLRPAPPPPSGFGQFPGWPAEFEGRPLTRLTPSDLDRRFVDEFTGLVARFDDGAREIVFRWAPRATRAVHPSSVCFQAAGWDVEPRPIRTGPTGAWSAFRAERDGETLLVLEQVRSGAQTWPDVTSWTWDDTLGRTSGPAWIVTVAEREPRDAHRR